MAEQMRQGRRPALMTGCAIAALLVVALAAAPFVFLRPSIPSGSVSPIAGRSATPPGSDVPSGTYRTVAPAPSRSFAVQTVQVPSSIDATGKTDVSSKLEKFIETQPDGSTIDFPPVGVYRVDQAVILNQRHDLTIRGNGATLIVTAPAPVKRTRDQLRISGGSNVTIQGLAIVGAETGDAAVYYPKQQWDAGISILGAQHVLIDHVSISNTYGDCIYVASLNETPQWSDDVTIQDSTCTRPGRQGISIVAGKNVTVQRTTVDSGALWAFDIEPDTAAPLAGATNILIDSNTVVGTAILSARGAGPVDHLTVSHNNVRGYALVAWVGAFKNAYRFSDITLSDNSSDTGADGPIMLFDSLDNVIVKNNHQMLWSGALVECKNCTNVSISS